MPGRVVKVLVAPGDAVVERQPVTVLEAMKMQNDVRAMRAGRVVDVKVVEGTLVDAGAVLVVIGAEMQSKS
jgi:biotin carboxyl carrier protein